MSDTGKTILWIVVAVVVIAVIIWLFTSARRSKEADARRFEASELRAQVQERLPQVQKSEDRASVTGQLAAEAKAEADEKAQTARQLEEQAEQHRASAAAARAEHEDLARRADLVDPDVPTDEEGYLVDDTGRRLAGQDTDEPSHPASGDVDEQVGQAGRDEQAGSGAPATTTGAGAGAGTAAALGAAYTHDEDDEEDLADAENPFASTTSPEAEPLQESAQLAAEPEPSDEAEPEPESRTVSESEPTMEAEPETQPEPETQREPETQPEPETQRKPEAAAEPAPEAEADSEESGDAWSGPTFVPPDEAEQRDLETASPSETVAGAVPALQDRDEHVALGGTPESDPGDHRGQPWATTPGVPGLEEDSAEPEVKEPQPALDTGQGVEGLDDQGDQTAPQSQDAEEPEGAEPSSGRRISSFEEVADGGFGIGSAAPIADGAQPLGHAVKGTRDGRTFLSPSDTGYDDVEPDVWFYNEEAARRAGFDRKEG